MERERVAAADVAEAAEAADPDEQGDWLTDEAHAQVGFSSETLREAMELRLVAGDFPVPPLPAALMELNAQAAREDWDIAKACETLERDAALAGRVLSTASAAAYGFKAPSNLRQAVMRLGAIGLRDLCFALMLGQIFPGRGAYRLLIEQEHLEAFPRARACQTVFHALDLDRSVGFLGGLLGDIGRLAMLAFLADHPQARRRVDLAPPLLDLLHAEIGAAVIARWDLEPALGQIARWHHDPRGLPEEAEDHAGHLLAVDEVRAVALTVRLFEMRDSTAEDAVTTLRLDEDPLALTLDNLMLVELFREVVTVTEDAEGFGS
jgi:HD-like signal output (HDOD) protein